MPAGYDRSMTYPPQDPGTPAGDQYGQSQPGAQPPAAGGYVPGQVGADAQYPTTQLPAGGYGQAPGMQPPPAGYSQPDPNAQYYSAPGYDPAAAAQPGYGQYGPPPVQAKSGGGGTTILVIVVVLLMAVGGVAGYFLLGNNQKDEGSLAGDDSATSENAPDESEDPSAGEHTEEPAPSGTGLAVASLGSITPIPGAEWAPYYGPGESYGLLNDSEGYAINHTETWISYFGVGLFSGVAAPYDPADLNATAEGAAAFWLTDAFGSAEGYQQGEITYTEVEVDGRPGVLAEWRNSWTADPNTTDTFEDTAILVVDVDGVNGFVGVASVSETGTALYASAVDALLATDFDAEAA